MAATGKVAVYIEHGRDLAALKKVIKLLMAYNQQVDQINFLINSTVYLDHVYERLHDWIEVCRQFACMCYFLLSNFQFVKANYFGPFLPDPRTQTCGVHVCHALTRSGVTTSVRRGAAFISHRTPLTSSLMSTLEAPATKTALATPSSEKFEIAT